MAIRLPGTDVHEVIQAHRRYLVQLMQEWTRIKDAGAEGDLSLALAVDAELFRLDSVVRWLDAVEARLRRAVADGQVEPASAPDAQAATARWSTPHEHAGAPPRLKGLRPRRSRGARPGPRHLSVERRRAWSP